jgi:hypothetical protein
MMAYGMLSHSGDNDGSDQRLSPTRKPRVRWTVGRSVGGSFAEDDVDLNHDVNDDDDPLLREHRDGVSPLPGEGGGGGR